MQHINFVHPVLRTPLVRKDNTLVCEQNGDTFTIQNGVPIFVPQDLEAHMEEERSGLVNTVKTLLRTFPWLYVALIYIISPVCHTGLSAQRFLKRFSEKSTLLNIGSGVHTFTANVLNVDIFYYKGVDIVADATRLPLADNSIDGIICESLLEHVPDPNAIMADMLRVLKPGGQMYIVVPFVYPFHACPNDFYRWSQTGVQEMCKGATIEKIGVRSGPSGALMGQLTTWVAIVLSFGWTPLYNLLSMLLLVIFFPIKFLDYLFARYPTAIHGAGQFYAVVTK
ncbi:MAG: class I SAM-dependent methyltransferase [Candidatus Peribacteraceae bacterium]|nr:class I SAM-dependent methyltransferase [Candidatus Peribacteraceae bacterium]